MRTHHQLTYRLRPAGIALLVAGLLSRVAAFGIGATISVAAVMVHLQHGFFMNWFGQQAGHGVEYHILMAAIAAAVVIQGGGRWALDTVVLNRLSKRSESAHVAAGTEPVAA